MARRFAPIPHDAYDSIDAEDGYAVLDLYMRAHGMRWRPMKVTERKLARRWGVSGRRVWIILDTLADLDLLTVEKGTGRKPTIITVLDPTKGVEGVKQEGQQERQQEGQQEGQQNGAGSKGVSADFEAQVEAQVAALVEAQVEAALLRLRPETEPEPRPETEPEAEVSAPPTAPDLFTGTGTGTAPPGKPAAPPAPKKGFGPSEKRKAAQRIYDAYRLHHPQNAEVPSRGDMKKLVDRLTDAARMLKGKRTRYRPEDWTTAEQDLIDLSEWIHIAPDAKFWRGGNRDGSVHLGITPIYKEDKFSDRLQKMAAWRTGGRGTKPIYSGDRGDIAPAPEPVGPQTTGAQWKRLAELDDIVKDKASTGAQVDAALAEIELIESDPGAPLP